MFIFLVAINCFLILQSIKHKTEKKSVTVVRSGEVRVVEQQWSETTLLFVTEYRVGVV